MNTSQGAEAPRGQGLGAAQERCALSGFEERLLTDLKTVVAERAPLARLGAPGPGRSAAGQLPGAGWRAPRPKVAAAATALAAAAAVTIGIVTATGSPAGSAGQPGGTAPGGASSPQVASVLHHAALAALQLPAGAPRPGQFVYSRVLEKWRDQRGHAIGPAVQQEWISADGRRIGREKISGGLARADTTVRLPACRDGSYHDPILGSMHCTADDAAGYLPDLPVRPAALRAFLKQHIGGTQVVGSVLWDAEQVMMTRYLLPRQRAAMYELLAGLPGLILVPHATNVQGKTGIGVRADGYKGGDYTIIFDPKTFAPLGMNWTTALGNRDGEVQTRLAAVDKAGQLP